ncbi:MAG: DUF4132 domain-containing protein [Planctomycetes bacterium]|nr:DUF4132 domain-containing protein [Planctomycetota bacterium]
MDIFEANLHIRSLREPKWLDKRLNKLARWPGKKRTLLRGLFTDPEGWENDRAFRQRLDKVVKYFAGLSVKTRQELWRGLFPKLGPHLERAWLGAGQGPYEFGYLSYPFRAPNRKETVDKCRAQFFLAICEVLYGHDRDVEWLAIWAPHLPIYGRDAHVVGRLLGAVLCGGGTDAQAVRSVLVDSINGEHEVGQMGWHVVTALLNSEERSDWKVISKLLLAAQRQEGLRQTILETVQESNPGAFRYMLGVIAENNLERFSSTVRAFDVWLGMNWAGGSTKVVNSSISRLIEYFDDESARARAITEGEPEDAFLALWVAAYEDADHAVRLAGSLLEDDSVERRYVALRTLDNISLFPECVDLAASRIITGAETEPRMQMATMHFLAKMEWETVSDEMFTAATRLFESVPAKKKKLQPIVWPWVQYDHDRRWVAAALKAMTLGSPEKMIPFAAALGTDDCIEIVENLAGIGTDWRDGRQKKHKRRKLTTEARGLMLKLLSDARKDVHKSAFEAMGNLPVEEDEVEVLLGALHRTSASLRLGAIGRLAKLSNKRAVGVTDTLLADRNAKKRAAGLELASQLIEANRLSNKVRDVVRRHRELQSEPELAETADRLLGGETETVFLADCLGLVPPKSRSTLPTPEFKDVRLETNATCTCLKELGELFLQHGETEIEVVQETSKQRVLLASAGSGFPRINRERDTVEDAKERLPLYDIWLDWLKNRRKITKDADGLEWVRLVAWMNRGHSYKSYLPHAFRKKNAWDLNHGFVFLVEWMMALSKPKGGAELLVQYVEDVLAKKSFTKEEKKDNGGNTWHGVRHRAAFRIDMVRTYLHQQPSDISEECIRRYCLLSMVALERSHDGCERGPLIEHFVKAYDAQLLNEFDLIWLLLHPREQETYLGKQNTFGPFQELSGLREPKGLEGRPKLIQAVHKVRERIIEIELTRGERMTPASVPAKELRYSGGAGVLFKLAGALGRDKIVRQHEWGDPTRAFSFSHLIAVTAPGDEDSFERFKALFDASGMKPKRLIEIAMFAPQWAAHTEFTLESKGLEDAVWWVHAHTKDNAVWRDAEFRDLWASRISERTELEANDLEEGAVDVAWFKRVVDVIGVDGWDDLLKPAKYASSSGGHKRAELFATAMLDRVTTADLTQRIDDKRHQDSVRALGLVPLPTRKTDAKSETLHRYKRLQEFKRKSRKFGSQRQASEGRAVEIGMQNLARTAGYRDPRRLQWAMESEAVADLARGPVEVSVDETTVSLAITPAGDPQLTVVKKGRTLKSVPAKLRKHEPIAEMRSRVTELRRQRSRMRLSLEQSMCRGDAFSLAELQEFFAHPMLRPMVERLIFVGSGELIGYPQEKGRVLRNHRGDVEPIGKKDTLRIAHSIDLLDRGEWSAWQRDCFSAERVQPFKQIFRETYPKTANELDKCDFTRRYAGHQVNPRQALALLKQRQWVFTPEEGVRKTFHDERLIAQVWFQQAFCTPAEIEDLTLEGVVFLRRCTVKHESVAITDLPDRLFSEAMRDLDLVVSVAHAGGVDPEASASTVEMRATLVRETCQLLRLSNVRIDGHHVKIDGKRGSYSVHLGSATTNVLPGRILIIVAVHSQYRGRLFLPFADDDPKTAEVLSKTLLLARDDEIKDPSILEQIGH